MVAKRLFTFFAPMKISLPFFLVLTCGLSGFGQGTITFNNNIPGQVVAPIYGTEPSNWDLSKVGNTSAGYPPGTQVYGGELLAGDSWNAQLLGAPGIQPESALVPISPITTFQTGTGAGFIVPVTFVPSAFPEGTLTATFQMVVWDKGPGVPDWQTAQFAWRFLPAGKSPLFVAPVGGNTTFLQSFNVYILYVPEPSSLGLLSLAALAYGSWQARRGKR